MASILVNGSPTSEFPFYCGLKQGDPLAPFLFILVMESLHISVSKAVNEGVFKGLSIQGSDPISHLFYADDAVFIGEWSEENLVNLVRILDCFYLASGLKINLHKSQVLGVGVPRDIVIQGASLIGCDVLHTPFKYLGVTVGVCMSRHSAWVDKKITWVAWDKVLSSKKKRGLGTSHRDREQRQSMCEIVQVDISIRESVVRFWEFGVTEFVSDDRVVYKLQMYRGDTLVLGDDESSVVSSFSMIGDAASRGME
ncbi:RNA-directed DNA polymerase, eukaryota [Tanacetum coccineum]